MHENAARAWARPHDWVEVVFGLVAVLSPIWLTTDNAAMWTLIVLGALILLDGLASLAMPNMIYGEGLQMLLGVLLFISPWVIGYQDLSGAAWTSWIVGALTFIVGGAALQLANAQHSKIAGQH